MLNELRSRPDQGRQKRVAVIVTKTDLLTRTEIGRGLDDTDLREWLGRVGLGNTVRALDQVAAQVRYFASGLGTEPAGVADLLGWVTGLPAAGASNGDRPLTDAPQELPGTAPLRAPGRCAAAARAACPSATRPGGGPSSRGCRSSPSPR